MFFCIHLFILRYRFTSSSNSSFFLTTDPKFYKSKQTTVKLILFPTRSPRNPYTPKKFAVIVELRSFDRNGIEFDTCSLELRSFHNFHASSLSRHRGRKTRPFRPCLKNSKYSAYILQATRIISSKCRVNIHLQVA